jgi:pimeloyl-ACP methyl ester carboxylesterase
MSSRYFAGPADPDASLLELAAGIGYVVWAPDRVGYGASVEAPVQQLPMFTQAQTLIRAIEAFSQDRPVGAGCFLVGHSFGLKLSLTMAASPGSVPLLGIDGSGSGLTLTFEPGVTPPLAKPGDVNPSWGPRELYPPGTFDRDVLPVAPMPATPPGEVLEWAGDFLGFAHRVDVPVRFTFGDHERLWSLSDEHFAALRNALVSSPRVEVHVQRGAGHNVSLSRAARAYHFKALAFAEECVLSSHAADS